MTSLILSEKVLNITMNYMGEWGHKGYDTSIPKFTHHLYIKDIKTDKETNKESTVGGPVPITNVFGLKIQAIQIESSFPYNINDIYSVLLPSMASSRAPGCNTVKNIFLVGSILYVTDNGGGIFSEMPVGSRWYVKKYKASRSVQSPTRLSFSLTLWRWFKP